MPWLVISTCTGYLCPGLTSYVGERLASSLGGLSWMTMFRAGPTTATPWESSPGLMKWWRWLFWSVMSLAPSTHTPAPEVPVQFSAVSQAPADVRQVVAAADRLLEQAHLLAHGCRGNVQLGGCSGEAEVAGRHVEGAPGPGAAEHGPDLGQLAARDRHAALDVTRRALLDRAVRRLDRRRCRRSRVKA